MKKNPKNLMVKIAWNLVVSILIIGVLLYAWIAKPPKVTEPVECGGMSTKGVKIEKMLKNTEVPREFSAKDKEEDEL